MNILALDPSTKAIGWAYRIEPAGLDTAIWDGTKTVVAKATVKSGVWHPPYDVAHVLHATMQWIDSLFGESIPDIVGYEDASVLAQPSRVRAAGMLDILAVLRLVIGKYDKKVRRYAPNTIKKYASGNGNAEKHQMVDAANETFAIALSYDQHDEADAIWILDMVINGVPGMDEAKAARQSQKKRARQRKKSEPRLF